MWAGPSHARGGYVIGVNVKRFANSKYPLDVDEHIMTETMQDRKVELIRLGDASIALPGGIGTFDELTEIFSLAQLGIVNKPFGILNLDGYFDGFLKDADHARMLVAEDVETLLRMLDEYPREEHAK